MMAVVVPLLDAKQKAELDAHLAACDALDSEADEYARLWKTELLETQIDDILAEECVICGLRGARAVDVPFPTTSSWGFDIEASFFELA